MVINIKYWKFFIFNSCRIIVIIKSLWHVFFSLCKLTFPCSTLIEKYLKRGKSFSIAWGVFWLEILKKENWWEFEAVWGVDVLGQAKHNLKGWLLEIRYRIRCIRVENYWIMSLVDAWCIRDERMGYGRGKL